MRRGRGWGGELSEDGEESYLRKGMGRRVI